MGFGWAARCVDLGCLHFALWWVCLYLLGSVVVLENTRQGLDSRYLARKRRLILAELRSQAHFEATDTNLYEGHDPFDVPLARCESCGGKAIVECAGNNPPRWIVSCQGCERHTRETRAWPYLAALAWHQMNLSSLDYRELPLFWLNDLCPEAARKRMVGIRRDLELRTQLAGLDRQLARSQNRRPPGKTYQRRLAAYLQWALLALRLIKVAKARTDAVPSSIDRA